MAFWLLALALAGPPGAGAAVPAEADLRALRSVIQRVIQATAKAKKDFVFPREMRDIAWVQLRAGDLRGAQRTIMALPNRDAPWRDDVLVELAPAQAERGDVRGALQAASHIMDPAERTIALSLIAKAQAKAGHKDAAASTFSRAFAANASIGESARDIVLEHLAVSRAQGKDVKGALSTVATINEPRTRDDALAAIAVEQAIAGDATGALETAGAIQDPLRQTAALQEVAAALVKSGDGAGAGMMAGEVVRTAVADPALLWYPGSLLAVASALGRAGHRAAADKIIEEALRIADTFTDGGRKADALLAVAEALAESGDQVGATGILARALEIVAAVQDDSERSFALVGIAWSQIKRGDRHGASDILERALQAALALGDDLKKGDPFFSIAEAQVRAGNVRGAIRTAVKVRDPLQRAEALLAAAVAQLEAGDRTRTLSVLQQALEAASMVPVGDQRRYLAGRVACLQARGGGAAASLQTATSIGGDFDPVGTLLDIAVGQARAGDRASTENTLQRVGRIVAAIPDIKEDLSAPVKATARALVQIRGSKAAIAWATSQQSRRLRLWALMGVAEGVAFRIIEPLEPDMVDRPLTLRAGYGC